MPYQLSESHPLRKLFHGLTEHTFQAELGIADVRLVEYVAELLARFVPSEGVWALRDRAGRRLADVGAMLTEAEHVEEKRRGECLRHVGDYTLFRIGVFPESLSERRARQTGQSLSEYLVQGKRSYMLASTYYDDDPAPTLRRLSAEFELCAFGLSRVRQEWERLEPPSTDSPPPLLF
jgi:hypothetical protein